ncbi:mediator of RNA polymerase II transcription subunit 6 [Kluyveromyces marxianus]|uniref:Mediator of RNA polymerase II transcription subunit 6 n=1 Tax=Kluyveromyces marxianus TaxID=4911 RepID=A0ABX6EX42_KLUMA|nr:mediator of RNA polymerase II transcription subunit 6 [Kluyveromyces marxianus]BAP71219.1 mediator of RNA polymerase II transcription subunit 6 [Kluyveromyces marxianus]
MSLPPLDELQWKSPEWIQTFGLRTDNVLEYFSGSPFFEKTSNNQVVKMQQQFSQQGPVGGNIPLGGQAGGNGQIGSSGASPGADSNGSSVRGTVTAPPSDRTAIWERYPVHAMLERELMKMKGIEYILVLVREPDLWIIRKQRRNGPNETTTLGDYYVIGSAVYQSPTVYKIVQNRMLSTNYHLSHALSQLNKLVEFHPAQGASFMRSSDTIPTSVANNTTTGATTGHTIANTVSVPDTGMANTGTSGATAAATSIDPERRQDTINMEVMDKLMTTSIKANPVYI